MHSAVEVPAAAPDRGQAALDLVLYFVAVGAAHALDLGARRAGLVALPDLFVGVPAIITGIVTAHLLVRRRGQTWRELGLRRPARWATLPLWVLGTMVLLVLLQNLVVPLLSPFLGLPAPDFSKYDPLYGNLPLAAAAVVGIWLTASFPEELIFRGFLLDRFSALWGSGRAALWVGATLQAVVFGSAHYQWGLGGIAFTTVMGALFGTICLLAGRNLWPLILAHGILNSLSMVQLYFVRGSEIVPGM